MKKKKKKKIKKKFEKYENLILNYQISFLDTKMDTFLKNLEIFEEKHFSLKKLIKYKQKIEENEIKKIISRIKELKSLINDEQIFKKINFLTQVIIFDLKIFKKTHIFQNKIFITNSNSAVKLFLLHLLLYIEYENQNIYLNKKNFKILKNYCKEYLQNVPEDYITNISTLELVDILFNVSYRIFKKNFEDKNLSNFFFCNFCEKRVRCKSCKECRECPVGAVFTELDRFGKEERNLENLNLKEFRNSNELEGFEVIKEICVNCEKKEKCLNSIKCKEIGSLETISKIKKKCKICPNLKLDLLSQNLLSNLEESFLINMSNFWTSYFHYKYYNRENESSKSRMILEVEKMIFFHFFLSQDISFSKELIESCVTMKSLNFNIMDRGVFLKIGLILQKYSIRKLEKKKIRKKNKFENFIFFFKIFFMNYQDCLEEFFDVIFLNKKVCGILLKFFVEIKLKNKILSDTKRKFLWVKYAILENYSLINDKNFFYQEIEQLDEDVHLENENKNEIENDDDKNTADNKNNNLKKEEKKNEINLKNQKEFQETNIQNDDVENNINNKNIEDKKKDKEKITNLEEKNETNIEKNETNLEKKNENIKNNKKANKKPQKTAQTRQKTDTIISEKNLNQIHIDILRTKQWKGKNYQKKIEKIIISFFKQTQNNEDYFQGFNYITSFLYDYFQNSEKVLEILKLISKKIVTKFLTDDLSEKLNIINYQINMLIKKKFLTLYNYWKKIDLQPEIFFSGFTISLFTSFFLEDIHFVYDFWDLIIVEEWRGVVKILVFFVDVYFEDLMKLDHNFTLKFFGDLKCSEAISRKLREACFKSFLREFKLEDGVFEELEKEFVEVREAFFEE